MVGDTDGFVFKVSPTNGVLPRADRTTVSQGASVRANEIRQETTAAR
ncbi:hypothetical protein HALLA_18415 [Halostagnicola larsenii XH-48]|uniref:Uncharacterized protein n=1 Tax=Halostagnicola larsenii XH-48 TaxID=797299 RepID=W0JV63_9EURY|nr:hypothetical protein [Halostagnicola larsenii]AHG01160.1 hypothetical protein HALLA_18415 [Halostagnicola larsenii XH-48]